MILIDWVDTLLLAWRLPRQLVLLLLLEHDVERTQLG